MADVLKLLIAERDRLDRAIAILQGTAPRRGRPPGSGRKAGAVPKKAAKKKRGRPPLTAAQREAASKRMKAYWAAKRKAGKKK